MTSDRAGLMSQPMVSAARQKPRSGAGSGSARRAAKAAHNAPGHPPSVRPPDNASDGTLVPGRHPYCVRNETVIVVPSPLAGEGCSEAPQILSGEGVSSKNASDEEAPSPT